ncbi:hypothetical protein ACFLVX_02845 [Chloroflexota bacterium]
MFKILPVKLKKKSRKYPIKRDESGASARQRAFEDFDQGKMPAEVAPRVGISPRTARRYFADWKKLPSDLEFKYQNAKALRKSNREFFEETIDGLGAYLDMTGEEVVERLEKPWGLKQLLMGKWPDRQGEKAKSRAEARLKMALKLIYVMESRGISVHTILKQLLRKKDDPGQS